MRGRSVMGTTICTDFPVDQQAWDVTKATLELKSERNTYVYLTYWFLTVAFIVCRYNVNEATIVMKGNEVLFHHEALSLVFKHLS